MTRPRARAEVFDEWLALDPELDFPATKDDILASLERRAAPDDVLASARAMAVETYESRALAVAAADVEPVDEASASVRAKQALHEVPGVAQAAREAHR